MNDIYELSPLPIEELREQKPLIPWILENWKQVESDLWKLMPLASVNMSVTQIRQALDLESALRTRERAIARAKERGESLLNPCHHMCGILKMLAERLAEFSERAARINDKLKQMYDTVVVYYTFKGFTGTEEQMNKFLDAYMGKGATA